MTEVMMTEEEKEEMEKELRGEKASPPAAGTTPISTPTPTPGIAHPEQSTDEKPSDPTSPLTQDGPSVERPNEKSEENKEELAAPSTSEPLTEPSGSASSATHVSSPDTGTSTPKPDTKKRGVKLTPEQKAKIDQIGEERDKAMEKRVADLTTKLKEVRILPKYEMK